MMLRGGLQRRAGGTTMIGGGLRLPKVLKNIFSPRTLRVCVYILLLYMKINYFLIHLFLAPPMTKTI